MGLKCRSEGLEEEFKGRPRLGDQNVATGGGRCRIAGDCKQKLGPDKIVGK